MTLRTDLATLPLLAVLVGLGTGCTQVDVYLTAYRSRDVEFPEPGPANTVGLVVSSNQEPALLGAEVAAKLTALLQEQGYSVASADEAAYALSCRFSIDDGRTATRAEPVHEPGQTYHSYYYGPRRVYAVRTTALPGRTRYVPRVYTVYTRSLSLSLFKPHPATQRQEGELTGPPVWQCDAYSPGESSDLRWVLNHLLLAAMDHFGEDTARQVHISLAWRDERVKRLAQTARQ